MFPNLRQLSAALLTTLLVPIHPLPLPAQDATPVIRSTSRLILLDVVVADKAGHPVHGLTRDDFTILENGAPQKIVSFEAVSPSGPPTPEHTPRTIILLDQLNITFADLAYARDRIALFLERNPPENQLTALMTVNLRGLSVLQDFTHDSKELKEKLARFRPMNANPKGGDIDLDWAQEHAQTALKSLLQVARASVGSPSSLTVVFVTSGFFGLEASNDGQLQTGLREVANVLIHSRMRLYTIDPSGVIPLTSLAASAKTSRGRIQTGHDSSAAQMMASAHNQQNAADNLLGRITGMTGGLAYYGRNDVETAIQDAISDGASAYLISYAPSDTNFHGEYRKIEVHTNVESSTVRTRDGYYATPDENVVKPEITAARLDAAMASPLKYEGVFLQCPAAYDAATGYLTGKLIARPNSLFTGLGEADQLIRITAYSKDSKPLDTWSYKVNWKNAWTSREVSASFNRPLSGKPKLVRFLVSDPQATRIGTCEFQMP